MADFITVMTDAGLGLISDLIEDEDSIEFTSLVVGDGTYEASEKTFANLKTKTALKSLKETYAISMGERTSAEDVRLQSNIANYDPQTGQALFNEGFYVNEIGVMARPKSGGTEILFSISVTTQAQGDYLPHYEGTNPVEMVQDVLVKVSNQSSVTFTYSASAFALASNLSGHISAAVTDNDGVHGLRLNSQKLQYKNGETWADVPMGNDIGLAIKNGKICQTFGTE